MKEGFVPRKGEMYLLLREKREKVCKFISEQLRKGYIRPLKSPQIVPVFFIENKDEKKHIVQKYRYLNEWTVKNNYPLPLISDIVENIDTKKVFTKMGLQLSWNALDINNFYFILFYFSILLFFFFFFFFFLKSDEEARDNEVTWHVT